MRCGKLDLFDNRVGLGKERLRNRDAEGFRSLEIDR
jgi:hypothetical protein